LAAELDDDEGFDDELGDELLDGDAELGDEEEVPGVDDLLHPATLNTTAMAMAAAGATKRVRMTVSCAVCGESGQAYGEVADILVRNVESDNG
jgi:hypothetical protein